MKKDKMFAMRMSSADYDRIQNKAQLSGMTMTDFLTLSALGKEIIVVNGLDAVTVQLKAIGKNLNQLTVLCNMGRIARRFEGFEVQIATHIDRDHWHNHLIVNSVSCETGLKLQFNEKDLEQLRTLSDEICAAHGLEILKPYEKPAMKSMGAGEYRSAVRSGSYKFQLMNAIDTALSQSRTQAEFTACMGEMG